MRTTRMVRAMALFSACWLTSLVAAPETPPAPPSAEATTKPGDAAAPKKAMTDEERQERVKTEVARRRALRQTLGDVPLVPARDDGVRGGVFPPASSVPAAGPVTIHLPDAPVELAAVAYTRISGKEVLVSSRACYLPVSFEVNKVPADEARVALEAVLNRAGVIVHVIDENTVAFVLKPAVP